MRPMTLALLAMMFCPVTVTAEEAPGREITGQLTYLQRIALPEGSEVSVQALGPRGVVLGETGFITAGEQVPLPFSITVPDGAGVRLVAAIGVEGAPQWSGGPVAVGPEATEAGEIRLLPGGLPAEMICGDLPVTSRFDGAGMELSTPRGDLRLMPVPAASGTRYEAVDDPRTWFWPQGEVATLALEGEEYPECRLRSARWRAGGNEPFWSVAVDGADAVLTTPDGTEATGILEAPVWRNGAVEWASGDDAMRLRITDTICRDTMTGMPHPETVTLITPGQERSGCGGDPLALLTGAEWVIVDVGGKGIIADANLTMSFRHDGSVGGSGGCNRFNAGFDLTGEGLSIGPAAATMMACEEPLMAIEQALFQAIAGVARFDIDATGALVLIGADDAALITARR